MKNLLLSSTLLRAPDDGTGTGQSLGATLGAESTGVDTSTLAKDPATGKVDRPDFDALVSRLAALEASNKKLEDELSGLKTASAGSPAPDDFLKRLGRVEAVTRGFFDRDYAEYDAAASGIAGNNSGGTGPNSGTAAPVTLTGSGS